MNRFYWFLNKPWVALPILLRAYRVSHHRRVQRDAQHIAWAHSLIGRPRQHDTRRLNEMMFQYVNDQAKPKFKAPRHRTAIYSFDPQDGFPYPPA